jgi:hypothetical protein
LCYHNHQKLHLFITSKIEILNENLGFGEKISNDDTEIIESNKLEKQLEIICTKKYPNNIANFTTKPNLSIEDKKFIVEYGPCRLNVAFPRNANGRCFEKSFYYILHFTIY